jgi:hypothetical protein
LEKEKEKLNHQKVVKPRKNDNKSNQEKAQSSQELATTTQVQKKRDIGAKKTIP